MIDKEECKHLVESLSDYIDGTLSEALCAELEKHLCECQDCRVVVDTTRKTIELYQAQELESELPKDVRARLFYRLDLQDFMQPKES